MFLNSHRPLKRFAIAVFVASLSLSTTAQSVDYGGYRPHYQGYGVNTRGGRGGAVCRVTSLNDAAWPPVPGTLRYCVEASSGPRFVIFEISGSINLAARPTKHHESLYNNRRPDRAIARNSDSRTGGRPSRPTTSSCSMFA